MTVSDLVFVGACAACTLVGYARGLHVGGARNAEHRSLTRFLCTLLREFDERLGVDRVCIGLGVSPVRPPNADSLKLFAHGLARDAYLVHATAAEQADRPRVAARAGRTGTN